MQNGSLRKPFVEGELKKLPAGIKLGWQFKRGGEANSLDRLFLMQADLRAVAGGNAKRIDDFRRPDNVPALGKFHGDDRAQGFDVCAGGSLPVWLQLAADFGVERAFLGRAYGGSGSALAGFAGGGSAAAR